MNGAQKGGESMEHPEPSPRRTAAAAAERLMHLLFLICGVAAIGFVLALSVYLILAGLPAIRQVGLGEFLLGTRWASTHQTDPRFGILPFLLTSVYGTAGAVVLGVPVGFLTAVFLAKAAPPRLAAAVRPAVELLAGVPSVIYGLVGMTVLVPALRRWLNLPAGDSLLAAILVLSVMILPSVVSVSETALRAVPRAYEEASLALGATELETYFRVCVPAARSGIAAAVVLGVGRAVGEAMAVLMVAGNAANLPALLRSVRFLTTAIAGELSYAPVGSLQRDALFSIGLVLFLFILALNALFNLVLKRKKD